MRKGTYIRTVTRSRWGFVLITLWFIRGVPVKEGSLVILACAGTLLAALLKILLEFNHSYDNYRRRSFPGWNEEHLLELLWDWDPRVNFLLGLERY